MIKIVDKSKCTGCSACVNKCCKSAITLIEDKEGFFYPSVNEENCINCSLCDKVCPILNEPEKKDNFKNPIVYAAWNKNEDIRIQSTSGGVFSALAEAFIGEGGIVIGAEYTEDFSIKHNVIYSLEEIKSLRQSKYAQSDLDSIFSLIKKHLDEGTKVMFCGTPCQNAGLKNFLNKNYDNVFLCDFICRGIISQKVYKKYLESVEKRSSAKITKVHFKNKDFGWNRFSTKLHLDNGTTYHKDRYNDEYMVGYLKHNLYLRPSCHKCTFKSLPRVADVSLGDFWGIGNKDVTLDCNKGTSVVLVNSEKGKEFFNKMRDDFLVYQECSIDDVVKGNSCLLNVASVGKYREYFFNNFEKIDFIDLIHKIDKKDNNSKITIKDKLYILKKKLLK